MDFEKGESYRIGVISHQSSQKKARARRGEARVKPLYSHHQAPRITVHINFYQSSRVGMRGSSVSCFFIYAISLSFAANVLVRYVSQLDTKVHRLVVPRAHGITWLLLVAAACSWYLCCCGMVTECSWPHDHIWKFRLSSWRIRQVRLLSQTIRLTLFSLIQEPLITRSTARQPPNH